MRKLVMVIVVAVIVAAMIGRLIYSSDQQKRRQSTATCMYQIRAALNVYAELSGGLLPPPPANASVPTLPLRHFGHVAGH